MKLPGCLKMLYNRRTDGGGSMAASNFWGGSIYGLLRGNGRDATLEWQHRQFTRRHRRNMIDKKPFGDRVQAHQLSFTHGTRRMMDLVHVHHQNTAVINYTMLIAHTRSKPTVYVCLQCVLQDGGKPGRIPEMHFSDLLESARLCLMEFG
jgi:hypothetical protein